MIQIQYAKNSRNQIWKYQHTSYLIYSLWLLFFASTLSYSSINLLYMVGTPMKTETLLWISFSMPKRWDQTWKLINQLIYLNKCSIILYIIISKIQLTEAELKLGSIRNIPPEVKVAATLFIWPWIWCNGKVWSRTSLAEYFQAVWSEATWAASWLKPWTTPEIITLFEVLFYCEIYFKVQKFFVTIPRK